MSWYLVVLNYHPEGDLLQYKSLNDELEFNYGFTRIRSTCRHRIPTRYW